MSLFHKRAALTLVLMVVFIDWLGLGLAYPMFSSMVFDRGFSLLPESTTNAARGAYLGVLLAALSVAQFFSAPILGALSDASGRKKILIWSLFIGVIGYFLAVIAVMHQHLYFLIFSRLVIGTSTGSAAIASACIADISSSVEEKTKNFGLFNMASGLGFTVGPFLGGKLSSSGFGPFAGFPFPFFIAGLVVLINAVLMFFFFKETHFLRKPKKLNWIIGIHNLVQAFKHRNLRILFLIVLFFAFGWSFFWEFIPVTWIKRYHLDASGIGSFYAFAAGVYAISSAFLIRPLVHRFKASPTLFYALAIQAAYMFLFLIPMQPFLGMGLYSAAAIINRSHISHHAILNFQQNLRRYARGNFGSHAIGDSSGFYFEPFGFWTITWNKCRYAHDCWRNSIFYCRCYHGDLFNKGSFYSSSVTIPRAVEKQSLNLSAK